MESLFIAIKLGITPKLIKLVRNTQVLLRKERIKWVSDIELHVKLAVVNNLGERNIKIVAKRLQDALSEMTAFDTSIRGFGNIGSHTFWAGVEQSVEFIILRDKINMALGEFKEPDQVDFVPHVLLAKVNNLNDKRTFFKIIDANRFVELDEIHIKSISLMSSELMSYGPVLSVVENIALKEAVVEELV